LSATRTDQHADLVMMTASACKVAVEEIVYDRAQHGSIL